MQYDPIKRSLGKVFNRSPFLRKLFYKLLDLLLLRTWHIKKDVREWVKKQKGDKSDKSSINVLDAGSGYGQYTYFLSGLKIRPHVTAVDVKEDQIADCNDFFKRTGRNNAVFSVADLTTFDKKNEFDLVLCVDVMEHITEDSKVFSNFHASLKQEGMLLVSTPSDRGGSDVHDHDDKESFIGEHVRDGYGIKEITEKLMNSGFAKVDARYVYGTPGKISWKLSMKYPIQMLGVSKLFFILLPFYYLLTFPLCQNLNYMDVILKHKSGTGLVVKAWK
ncbi:MAG: class I SAM-dependent methyltransferase [Bacteroidota bacterium]